MITPLAIAFIAVGAVLLLIFVVLMALAHHIDRHGSRFGALQWEIMQLRERVGDLEAAAKAAGNQAGQAEGE